MLHDQGFKKRILFCDKKLYQIKLHEVSVLTTCYLLRLCVNVKEEDVRLDATMCAWL